MSEPHTAELAAALAEGEHVSGPAIAQLLDPLKAAGLVTAEPHRARPGHHDPDADGPPERDRPRLR